MNFWIIHAQENPAQPRDLVGRREWRSNTLSETLADRGHHVTRWRSSFSHQQKQQLTETSLREPIDNYHHQFIFGPKYQRHVGPKRIRHHRALGRNFTAIAESYDTPPDLIHVCNVPIELCHAAVKYGQTHDIPVVIDVRDLWPDVYLEVIPARLAPLRRLAEIYFNTFSLRLKYAFRHASAITALTKSYMAWGLQKAGRTEHENDAIFPMCYPKVEIDLDPVATKALQARLGLKDDDMLACYFGNIGHQSDFEIVMRTAKLLQTRAPNVKFIIAGSGPREEEMRKLAADLPNVIVPGWLEGAEVQALMSLSTFGLVIYKPVANFLRNIPNKFSEYLSGGQVIVCGLGGEMGDLTQVSGCGFVYEAGNAEALATEIETLSADPETRAQMSRAATQLHHTHFDGSELYSKFADYLESLSSRTQ